MINKMFPMRANLDAPLKFENCKIFGEGVGVNELSKWQGSGLTIPPPPLQI